MKNEILDFMMRRFPLDKDCNWMSGNCYYFAIILKERFSGELFYDTIEGHFLIKIEDNFYDWTGIRYPCEFRALVAWDKYEEIDPLHYKRIIRDVIE